VMARAAGCWSLVGSTIQTNERSEMAIGPVQLIVLGFDHPDFHGEVIVELERLRDGFISPLDCWTSGW
jgi:hypothetical protein